MSRIPSTPTKSIAFRQSNEVYDILERRASKQGISVGEYVKRRIKYDTLRKHGK